MQAPSHRPITTGGIWPWLGIIAFVLGYFATWAIQFSLSEDILKQGGPVLLEELDTGTNELLWRISSGIGFVGIAFLIPFAAGLRRLLEARSEGDSIIPSVVWASFVLTAGALIIAWSFRAQMFDGINYYEADPSGHVTINRLSQDTGLTVWAGLGVASAAMAVAGLRTGLVPRWYGWFSAVMTVLIAFLCLVGAAFPANFPAGVWLLVTAIWAMRQAGVPSTEARHPAIESGYRATGRI